MRRGSRTYLSCSFRRCAGLRSIGERSRDGRLRRVRCCMGLSFSCVLRRKGAHHRSLYFLLAQALQSKVSALALRAR